MPVIEVNCPCCDEIIEIQTETSKVLSHRRKKPKMDLSEFIQQDQTRGARVLAKFEESQKKEGDRRAALDAKFESNRRKGESLKDPPGIQWD